jgi:hypothetical protein
VAYEGQRREKGIKKWKREKGIKKRRALRKIIPNIHDDKKSFQVYTMTEVIKN